jgi:hypothetical protein
MAGNWHSRRSSGLLGLIGVPCTAIVARCLNSQTTHRLAFEDWLFHALLPLAACALLAVSYLAVPTHTREFLFGVDAATLLLLISGIHNAWDTLTCHGFVHMREANAHAHREGET